MTQSSQPEPGAMLSLAVASKMMMADGHIAEEEMAILSGLLDVSDLSASSRDALAQSWAERSPDPEQLAAYVEAADEGERSEALALAWVVALSDGHVDPTEEAAFLEIAASLGLADEADVTRQAVETMFYAGALTVVGAMAVMARNSEGELDDRKAAYFEEAVIDMQLPEPVYLQGQGLLSEPIPMHGLLVQAASLTPDFQEGLLGNVWAVAWADGDVDDREQRIFERFVAACGLPSEQIEAIKAEWGDAEA